MAHHHLLKCLMDIAGHVLSVAAYIRELGIAVNIPANVNVGTLGEKLAHNLAVIVDVVLHINFLRLRCQWWLRQALGTIPGPAMQPP